MDWADARTIYEELNSVAAKGTETFSRLRDDLLRVATRYADLRIQWVLPPPGKEKGDHDRDRTLAHNVFIDSCNAMSRAMASHGSDTGWR